MQEDETIAKYSNRIFSIVNRIILLDEDFSDNRIVEKLLWHFQRDLNKKSDLTTISLKGFLSTKIKESL